MASLLLALTLAVSLLSACREAADQGRDVCASPGAPPALDVARALCAAVPDGAGAEQEVPDGELETYIEAAYGLDAAGLTDCAVIRGTGVSAYEMAVLYFSDESGAKACEAAVRAYPKSRENAFTGYAPTQAALAAGGRVSRSWRYVGLFICGDPESAEEVFRRAVEDGYLPEAEVPEPEPLPGEPEPLPGEPEAESLPVDMLELMFNLAEICAEEIDAGGGREVMTHPGTSGFLETVVEPVFGVDPDTVESCGLVRTADSDSAFALLVLYMKDADSAEAAVPVLEDFLERRAETLAGSPAQAELVKNGAVSRDGRYVSLFVCREPEAMGKWLLIYLSSPAEDPAERPTQVRRASKEIAEGVYVTEVPWPEREGTADPNRPDRILFVPSGENENMRLYDASAVVSAWGSGDPSGLTEYDRAIYDGAKRALGEIISEGMSDFEKEVEIYDWVLRNVAYDWRHMDMLDEAARDSYTPYGGLVNGEAVCLGYAATFQLLMELAGVECVTVIGAGGEKNDHAWNMVRLNGQWYCADPTWEWSFYDAGMMDGREWRFFNVTSAYMARTTHQWDYGSVPEAVTEDYGCP